MIIIGVIASIFLAAGLLPPYYEMWKRRGRVVGINLFFIVMDWFGAFFSLMALGTSSLPSSTPANYPRRETQQAG